LWDEISINTNAAWVMEFASFLRLDQNQYHELLMNNTSTKKVTQNYQLWRLERKLNFTDEQVKRFVLYRTFMMNDPDQTLYKLYISKDLELEKLD
jgi:hypothetical protein